MSTNKQLIYKDEAYSAVLHSNPASAYCIARIKPVDAVEVVHGRWENIRFITTGDGRVKVGDCSSCKSIERVRNYCPNCGALMDGGNEDGV